MNSALSIFSTANRAASSVSKPTKPYDLRTKFENCSFSSRITLSNRPRRLFQTRKISPEYPNTTLAACYRRKFETVRVDFHSFSSFSLFLLQKGKIEIDAEKAVRKWELYQTSEADWSDRALFSRLSARSPSRTDSTGFLKEIHARRRSL